MDDVSAADSTVRCSVEGHSSGVAMIEFGPRLNREIVENMKGEAPVVIGSGPPLLSVISPAVRSSVEIVMPACESVGTILDPVIGIVAFVVIVKVERDPGVAVGFEVEVQEVHEVKRVGVCGIVAVNDRVKVESTTGVVDGKGVLLPLERIAVDVRTVVGSNPDNTPDVILDVDAEAAELAVVGLKDIVAVDVMVKVDW